MANIVINEVSQNYTYNIGNSSFATVALPITSCWGPGYVDSSFDGEVTEEELESVVWSRFPATQAGLEAFVSAFRGPISNYRLHKDYSYQQAMTLLTAGYDVLVCRITAGSQAQATFTLKPASGSGSSAVPAVTFTVKAKYNGTFGNKLRVLLQKVPNYKRWNIVTYVIDDAGVQTAVENKTFVFEINNSTDTILHIDELESNFLEVTSPSGAITDDQDFTATAQILTGGTDVLAESSGETVANVINAAKTFAKKRYSAVLTATNNTTSVDSLDYITALTTLSTTLTDVTRARVIKFREWLFTSTYQILSTLEDKLAYNPNRIIVPGWDDQDFMELRQDTATQEFEFISPLHFKLMEVAYYSRCAVAYIDIPRSLGRAYVYSESQDEPGYAQMLSRVMDNTTNYDINSVYYPSHSALFAPWGKYTYAGTDKQSIASPSFLALMIDRSMILNQTSQYEWLLPTSRKHSLKIGKLDYNISKKYLDKWQKLEGVGINCITSIPDLGVSIWGNSTLYEVPPATYQALANLSTRKLVNAIEDLAYRCGIAITFQYNNEQAYQSFYAGVTPLLDTMVYQGAIDDYYIRMNEDINGLDAVNANSVVGKIYLVIDGVINDIKVDLIALPPQTDLNEYRA